MPKCTTIMLIAAPEYTSKIFLYRKFNESTIRFYEDPNPALFSTAQELVAARGRLHCASICNNKAIHWDAKGCYAFSFDLNQVEENCILYI